MATVIRYETVSSTNFEEFILRTKVCVKSNRLRSENFSWLCESNGEFEMQRKRGAVQSNEYIENIQRYSRNCEYYTNCSRTALYIFQICIV